MEERRYKKASKGVLKEAYRTSYHTLKIWLAPFNIRIGEYRGQAYTPKQVKYIVEECIGEPEILDLLVVRD